MKLVSIELNGSFFFVMPVKQGKKVFVDYFRPAFIGSCYFDRALITLQNEITQRIQYIFGNFVLKSPLLITMVG
jgi:hypothetical protein